MLQFLVYGADGIVMDADAEDLKNMQECFRQMEEEDYKSFLEESEVCVGANCNKSMRVIQLRYLP